MGAKKNILNLFVKVVDDGKVESKAEIKEAIPAQPQFAATTSKMPPITSQEDAEIKKELAAALESANQSGYDYFELAQTIEAQANIIPSEELRFQSTAATVASMGVTPNKLISSAEYYLSVLKKKEDEFNLAVNQQTAKSVTSREAEVTQFDADMQSKSEQIKKLTEEINVLQTKKTAIINEIGTSKAKIDQVRNNFSATMKIFVDRINSDIEKIKKYLLK